MINLETFLWVLLIVAKYMLNNSYFRKKSEQNICRHYEIEKDEYEIVYMELTLVSFY